MFWPKDSLICIFGCFKADFKIYVQKYTKSRIVLGWVLLWSTADSFASVYDNQGFLYYYLNTFNSILQSKPLMSC